jgi:sulfur transfer protein SufE
MISSVTWDDYTLQPSPGKFEAGTPNIAGALGMAKAAAFISAHFSQIEDHEKALANHLLCRLRPLVKTGNIILLGNIGTLIDNSLAPNAIALAAFYSPTMHANDIAAHLASQSIAVRAGHHCAMPLMQSMGIQGCVRLSAGCYTSFDELDAFVKSLSLLFERQGRNIEYDDLSYEVDGQDVSQLAVNIDDAFPIGQAISSVHDWNAKHRLLLINSKSLAILPESMRTEQSEIAGCEVKVWVALADKCNDGSKARNIVLAYSDSKVVRGILAIIAERINHTCEKDRAHINISGYLHQIGLARYFSEGRRDGIYQVIKRLEHEVKALI